VSYFRCTEFGAIRQQRQYNNVVPAFARTHTPRRIGCAMELVVFAKLASVVMGPGVRLDDIAYATT
jgi:hypothetical protein